MHATTGRDRLIRNGWRGWLRLFGVWSIPLFVTFSAYWMQGSAGGQERPPFAWFLVQNWMWFLWAGLCPWAYFLVVRYPSGRRFWSRGMPLHLLTGLAASTLITAVYGVFRALQYGGQTWWQGAWQNLTRPAAVGNIVQSTVVYGLVAGAMFAIHAGRQRTQREAQAAELELRTSQLESQLNAARLQSLQMQIQPHLLFNALNSIASLVDQHRNAEAFRMIGLLGALLRSTLDRARDFLPLHEELRLLGDYLEIEQVRFPERLECDIQVDPECSDAAIPSFLLQPIVENSVRHAVNRTASAGHLRIQARRREAMLHVSVRDDGPGLPARWSLESHAGVGLRNVSQRLVAHYGSRHRFEVRSNPDRGVTVDIEIPFRHQADVVAAGSTMSPDATSSSATSAAVPGDA